jgi:histidinol-phosphate/aromatic aminotransferase/cobyric acid decarboxylase-like protein
MSWKEHLRDGIPQLTALRLFDYGGAGPDIARLDCNELALAPSADEMETFVRALRDVAVHRYPDVRGLPLREALARRWGIEPDEILLGNGSVETVAMLVTAFGTNGGGAPAAVLYPDPSFPYYEVVARSHGASGPCRCRSARAFNWTRRALRSYATTPRSSASRR